MRSPSFSEEKKFWKKGYQCVVGLDEAGRGPLAGPVVASAVMIKNSKSQAPNSKQYQNSKSRNSKRFNHLNFENLNLFGVCDLKFGISGIRDSKKLSPKKREELYRVITKSSFIEWGIGRISEKKIDKINILEATKLAMEKAINNLTKKLKNQKTKKQKYYKFCDRRKYSIIDYLILDGSFKLNLPILQKSIVKADEKVFSCAVASIVAKVTRDKIMQRYAKKFPQYGFEKHKGYPTRLHLARLRKYGSCKIHRKSFKPMRNENTALLLH